MYKIAICGPRDKSVGLQRLEIFADRLMQETDLLVATGGVPGFPTELVTELRERRDKSGTNGIKICAYTYCSNSIEWVQLSKIETLPPMTLFDEIYWSPDPEELSDNRIMKTGERALARISRLIGGSKTVFAYLGGPGNTHIEVQGALSLGVPALCLVNSPRDIGKWYNIYRAVSRNPDALVMSTDPHVLVREYDSIVKYSAA